MNTEHFRFIRCISLMISSRYHVSTEIANFIGCQFALESAYGTSPLANKHKNFCGMKTPLVRISVALNAGLSTESDYWAKYSSLDDCVLDYFLCLQYHKPSARTFESRKLFKSFIKFYCPEKSYVERIESIYTQFIQTLNP